MQLEREYNIFVLVGIWNRGIFTPDWVTKFLMPDEKNIQVEIPLNSDGSFRFSTTDFRFFIIGNRMIFSIINKNHEVYDKITEIANRVSNTLPHTPVSAFGINFNFEAEENEKLKKLFEFFDNESINQKGLEFSKATISRTFKMDESDLNLNIIKEGDIYRIHMNYHHNIKDLVDFKGKFDNDIIRSFENKSLELLKAIYNLEIK